MLTCPCDAGIRWSKFRKRSCAALLSPVSYPNLTVAQYDCLASPDCIGVLDKHCSGGVRIVLVCVYNCDIFVFHCD